MTPFQRQIYEQKLIKESEQQEQMQSSPGGGQRPKKNSLAGTGGNTRSRSETVRYKTDGDNNEANTSFVD